MEGGNLTNTGRHTRSLALLRAELLTGGGADLDPQRDWVGLHAAAELDPHHPGHPGHEGPGHHRRHLLLALAGNPPPGGHPGNYPTLLLVIGTKKVPALGSSLHSCGYLGR